MKKSMFVNIRMAVSVLLVMLNTAMTSLIISFFAVIKLLFPFSIVKKVTVTMANRTLWGWATLNYGMLNLNNKIVWQIEGGEDLSRDNWYLLLSNHVSWADIVILSSVMKDKIPMTKFFLKHELLYVPFVGLACWGADMPFMRRNPERREDDFNAIKKSCENFRAVPTTVVNFVEGTRATPEKLKEGRTPYQHLFKPKIGGIAFTLSAMGELFNGIVDVTLAYPENQQSPFIDMLKGKLTKVVIRINLHPNDEKVNGDYFGDKAFKRGFHKWVNDLWKEKDEYLQSILNIK